MAKAEAKPAAKTPEKDTAETTTPAKGKGKSEGPIYTYIGKGEDSPRVINFMGKQKFIRGQATEVTDPEVLRKVKDNPTFVEGEADQETLHEIDEQARLEAEEQRLKDARTNAAAQRKNNKWAGKGD